MVWGAWRSRIWVAALATTAWPSGLPEQVGGVLGDDGQPAPVLAGRLGHAEQELGARRVGHEQPRLVDHDQAALAVGRVRHPAPDGVQGEQRPGRFELVGQVAQAEDDEVAVGAGGGRPVEEPPVGAGDERRQPGGQRAGGGVAVGLEGGGQVAQQRGGAGVAARIGGDPDRLVGGDDAPVERGGRRRVGLRAEQHGDQGVDEQRPADQGVGAGWRGRRG